MIIIGPVAVAANNVIGKNNDLPWDYPEDLKHFRNITRGKTVLMGRKTFESIVARIGKPLPDRKNVVITSKNHELGIRNYGGSTTVEYYKSLEEAFSGLEGEDVYIIGGAGIFAEALPFGDYMYFTHIKKNYDGDVYFPQINWNEWEKITEEDKGDYSFTEYKRIRN